MKFINLRWLLIVIILLNCWFEFTFGGGAYWYRKKSNRLKRRLRKLLLKQALILGTGNLYTLSRHKNDDRIHELHYEDDRFYDQFDYGYYGKYGKY
ncbi:hypothetical protein BLOT_014284 [Blomia tropicalis]|nr:hypothetical protein BLOT_014284 [Blomia tropicalis]